MISFEMTLPVGYTRKLLPRLEARGLRAGQDFNLVYSPERVKSRHVLDLLSRNPKVVGGLTSACARRAAEFYRRYLGAPVENMESLEAAELVKLAGMVYRDVNIAVANELSRYSEALGIDFVRVIAAANTDGEAALLSPGIGVGGHCTPVYPHFVLRDAEQRGLQLNLVRTARQTNDDQPRHMLQSLAYLDINSRASTALILGLGFRPQVKEALFSPAFQLRDELARLGWVVQLHDPLYSPEEIRAYGFEPGDLTRGHGAPDVLVLNTAHEVYAKIDFVSLRKRGVKLIIDGRDFFDPRAIVEAGIAYKGVGRPAVGVGRRRPPEGMSPAEPSAAAAPAKPG